MFNPDFIRVMCNEESTRIYENVRCPLLYIYVLHSVPSISSKHRELMRIVDVMQSSDKRNTEGPASAPLTFQVILLQCIYVYVDIKLNFSNKPVEQLDYVCWENTTRMLPSFITVLLLSSRTKRAD